MSASLIAESNTECSTLGNRGVDQWFPQRTEDCHVMDDLRVGPFLDCSVKQQTTGTLHLSLKRLYGTKDGCEAPRTDCQRSCAEVVNEISLQPSFISFRAARSSSEEKVRSVAGRTS